MSIVLETPRLRIRQFNENDVDNLFSLNRDPAVMRYVGGPAPREVLAREIAFHLAAYKRFDRLGTFAADSVDSGEFLGWFHFRPGPDGDVTNIDLGYRLRRSTWNQGYATEGSRALIDMGFMEPPVHRVFAHTLALHVASRRVMEKCGLTLVRTIPCDRPVEGAEQGEVEYALTKPEWRALASAHLPSRDGIAVRGRCD